MEITAVENAPNNVVSAAVTLGDRMYVVEISDARKLFVYDIDYTSDPQKESLSAATGARW